MSRITFQNLMYIVTVCYSVSKVLPYGSISVGNERWRSLGVMSDSYEGLLLSPSGANQRHADSIKPAFLSCNFNHLNKDLRCGIYLTLVLQTGLP